MSVHDVTNGLVGDELLRFRDISQGTRLGLSSLKHHDVIFELHNYRIVTPASGGEPVETVAKLFGSDGQCRCAATRTASARSTGRCSRRCAATRSTATSRRWRWRNQRSYIGRIRLR